MTDYLAPNPPSPFIAGWVRRLAPRSTDREWSLDVAAGEGRHALVMALAGYRVVAIDIRLAALTAAAERSRADALDVSYVCADLTTFPLPAARFHLVVVSRYLDRGAFDSIRAALAPGGVLLYETFTTRQLKYGRGPRSAHHLLEPGELRARTLGMDLLFDEEVTAPEAVARVAARRRVGA